MVGLELTSGLPCGVVVWKAHAELCQFFYRALSGIGCSVSPASFLSPLYFSSVALEGFHLFSFNYLVVPNVVGYGRSI